jgi:8-oxo-dGTP pyrophosphatase MutT (NUDIX family)
LIERSAHEKDVHSGQISFPGGSYQEEDGDLLMTALRESEEEIGVARAQVQILGALTELYIPVSNFLVQPYVGVLAQDVPLRPQQGEVAQILLPKLNFFLDDASKMKKNITLGNGMVLSGVPTYDMDGKVIWGATAMIMNEFCELFKK